MIELAIKETNSNEMAKSYRNESNRGNLDSNHGAVDNRVGPANVNPAPLMLVEPKRESGSTRRKKTGSTRPVNPVPRRNKPPTFTGYKWKPSGLTGWELYTRKPSISKSGGRSSTGKYLGYYSAEAVKLLYAATQKTANTGRA